MVGALVLSVAINLALAGFLAGRTLEPRLAPPRMDPTLAFFPVLREFPEARRAELRPIMREQFRNARPDMRRMRDAQRSIRAALTATPFAEAALADALTDFRAALLASQEGSHAALVRLAQALTPAERELLATALGEGQREGRREGVHEGRRDGTRHPFPPGGGRMHPPPPPDARIP